MKFAVTIPGPPTSWKRARLGEKGSRARFTPAKMKQAKARARAAIHAARQTLDVATGERWPIDETYAVELAFFRRRIPKARPDLDNLVKLILDAANGVLWADDSQVVHLEAEKIDVRTIPDGQDAAERTELVVWVQS